MASFSLAGHQIPTEGCYKSHAICRCFRTARGSSVLLSLLWVIQFICKSNHIKMKCNLRKGCFAIWTSKWMLNGTISWCEINGSFPSPFLSWAADPYYKVYLQCLSPFLSECSQAVPLVTYLLTPIIDTCSIVVVQFTKKEQRQNSVWLFEWQEQRPHFHWPSTILPLYFAIFLLK